MMVESTFVLIAATIVIGVLCFVWMRSSRASQKRMEEMNRNIVTLLEEQNQLLRSMLEHRGR